MHILSRRFLTQYAFTAVVFLCIDLTWIALVAKKMYINTLSPILAGQPAWVPALAFYFIYSFGLWFLAIKSMNNPNHAAVKGAVVGLTAYGTYALTGQSLFAGWGWSLTFVDCAWGMVLSATVAYLTTRFFGQKA
jgi:uncharacterized membrane protein